MPDTPTLIPALRPAMGGYVYVRTNPRTPRGIPALDLSIIAGLGDSATVYVTERELCEWALDLLAHFPMEGGQELGELIEERRARV